MFPLTILEALAHGTPVIVHHAGGNREAVDKTGGGMVYTSSEEFHHALTKIAKDSQFRETLGRRAWDGYQKFYSQKQYLGRYLQLIQDIGKKKGVFSP